MLSTHGDHYHQLSRHFVSILKHVNLEKSKNMPPPHKIQNSYKVFWVHKC